MIPQQQQRRRTRGEYISKEKSFINGTIQSVPFFVVLFKQKIKIGM